MLTNSEYFYEACKKIAKYIFLLYPYWLNFITTVINIFGGDGGSAKITKLGSVVLKASNTCLVINGYGWPNRECTKDLRICP